MSDEKLKNHIDVLKKRHRTIQQEIDQLIHMGQLMKSTILKRKN